MEKLLNRSHFDVLGTKEEVNQLLYVITYFKRRMVIPDKKLMSVYRTNSRMTDGMLVRKMLTHWTLATLLELKILDKHTLAKSLLNKLKENGDSIVEGSSDTIEPPNYELNEKRHSKFKRQQEISVSLKWQRQRRFILNWDKDKIFNTKERSSDESDNG